MDPVPKTIAVSDAKLDDLIRRVRSTNWPVDYNNEDSHYGIQRAYLEEVVEYWLTRYDWRAVERRINVFDHYEARIDDVPIHFMRVPGKGPAGGPPPLPLILTHGWPWTFWDMHKVVGPLSDPAAHGGDPADAFEVIVPSLPGFGFSTPLPPAPMNFVKTADLWNRLMTDVLGFGRYAAAGGDWGATVTEQLGHKYAANLYGIHSIHPVPLWMHNATRYWDLAYGMLPAGTPPEMADPMIEKLKPAISHFMIQTLDPQTLAYAMHDSPVGLLAWLAKRRRDWSDRRTDWHDPAEIEQLITLTVINWVTDSFVTTARYYSDAARYQWKPVHDRMPVVEAPTGFTFLTGERLREAGEAEAFRTSSFAKEFNIHFLAEHARGGHFGHYENPDAVVHDIRATFRDLRS